MNPVLRSFRLFCIGAGSTLTVCAAAPTWYVATNGNDAWSGTLPAPNEAGNDGPKATLAAARDASREQAGQERRIEVGEGRFFLDQSLELDPRDAKLTLAGAGMGKTILYGGRRIEGWAKAGDQLWVAKLPEDQPDWSFRILVVNDAIQERARLPETGYLEHETKFPVRWMSTAGGGWERKPTELELTTMRYREGDIPADLRVANAEVTVCHMWDESTVAVAAHDPATRTLTFAAPTGHPAGAFNVPRYVVWNTREGMTRPGQWYLDRAERAVYFWPPEGMDMTTALVAAPTMETLVKVSGEAKSRVAGLIIRDLTLTVSEAPIRHAGFGAVNWPGAMRFTYSDQVVVDQVEVTNAGAWGIQEWAGTGLVVSNSHFHRLGGGGIRFGSGARIEGNRIHHIGLVSASSLGIAGGGNQPVIRRNVIHDTPYSGMSVGGTGSLIEENLIYRCMLVHHDGAAIYMGGGKGCIIRRNLVRDMVQVGQGYGVSAYYLDEKCQDCIVSENVAINVPHASQNHMTLNCELRDNVFIAEGDIKIAFSRCSGHKVVGNTFHLSGKLEVVEADAITEWAGNLLFVRNEAEGRILDDFPRPVFVPRDKPKYLRPMTFAETPSVDGKMAENEWPSGGQALGERPNQRGVRGAPTSVKIVADRDHLYILANIVTMFPDQRKLGTAWGVDEGIELAVQGRDGEARTTYVLRGFSDGTLQALTMGGATEAQAAALAGQVTYGASVDKQIWRSEWRVPFAALGLTPGEKTVLPFNLTAYRSEDDVFAQFAGTLGETWDLKLGGALMLNWDAPGANPARAALAVPRLETVPDGAWPGEAFALAQTPSAVPLAAAPASAQVARTADRLLVRVTVPAAKVTKGADWRTDDGIEVCLGGKTPDGKATTWVVRGYPNGTLEISDEAGTPAAAHAAARAGIVFQATSSEKDWTGVWQLPFALLGIEPKGTLPFNLGVYRSEDRQWINWIGTQGPTWKLESAGLLRLE